MKLRDLSKIIAVLMAIFVSLTTNAQVKDSDYEEYDAASTVPDDIDYVTLNSGGTTMGYYAKPDPYYHPNYINPGWTLTNGFTWNWSVTSGPSVTMTKPGDANYVEINFTNTGDYILEVTEQAPVAYGGCIGDSTLINIKVIDPPAINVATIDATESCGNQPAPSIVFNINENVPAELASYTFRYNLLVETIDVDGNQLTVEQDTDTDITKLNSTDAAFSGTSPDFTYTFAGPALDVINKKRTRYTISLVNDATHGITSAVSRKSDYLAGTTTYHPAGDTDASVVFIVNPKPVTGPIYHIPNKFDF